MSNEFLFRWMKMGLVSAGILTFIFYVDVSSQSREIIYLKLDVTLIVLDGETFKFQFRKC